MQGINMKQTTFRTAVLGVALGAMLLSLPSAADTRQRMEAQPGGGAMIVDALLVRPVMAAAMLGGTALFIVSMPFSAMGGNMEGAAETLVMTPARAAFARCLGCTTSLPRQESRESQTERRSP